MINNAAEFQHEPLDKISPDNLLRASIVNCHAPSLLARYFIPKMLERHEKVSKGCKLFYIRTLYRNSVLCCHNLRVPSLLSLMLEQTEENCITPATNLPFLEHQRRMFMLLVTKWERSVISRSKNEKIVLTEKSYRSANK